MRTPPLWRMRLAFSRTSTQDDSALRVIETGVSVIEDVRWPPWLQATVASGYMTTSPDFGPGSETLHWCFWASQVFHGHSPRLYGIQTA
jgi:hypothetical protein